MTLKWSNMRCGTTSSSADWFSVHPHLRLKSTHPLPRGRSLCRGFAYGHGPCLGCGVMTGRGWNFGPAKGEFSFKSWPNASAARGFHSTRHQDGPWGGTRAGSPGEPIQAVRSRDPMPAIAPSLAFCRRCRGAICDRWRRVLCRRTLLTRGQQTQLPGTSAQSNDGRHGIGTFFPCTKM
jgi:hypothetical protein